MPTPEQRGSFDEWIETHCYDCGETHDFPGGHDHCFDDRNGPRPQEGCMCGGCQRARRQLFGNN